MVPKKHKKGGKICRLLHLGPLWSQHRHLSQQLGKCSYFGMTSKLIRCKFFFIICINICSLFVITRFVVVFTYITVFKYIALSYIFQLFITIGIFNWYSFNKSKMNVFSFNFLNITVFKYIALSYIFQ